MTARAVADAAWPPYAFDRRLEPAAAAPIAVALSGGGDSLAALLATHDWAQRVGRRLVVLTVDHGLQAQSRDWTRFAAMLAGRIGADFEALAWTGDKPATGLAAAARSARHRLIAAAARRHGARVVVFGHTADDVAEAELMRREGSSVGAPREWAPSPVWPEGREVFLLRPLLDLSRAEIRERLVALGESWIDDPANENPTSLRARARIAMQQGGEIGRTRHGGCDGPTPPPSLRFASRHLPRSAVEDNDTLVLQRETGERSAKPTEGAPGRRASVLDPDLLCAAGVLTLARKSFRSNPDPAPPRLLGAALTSVGGGDRPPRGDRLAALADRLAREGDVTATLVGAKIIADSRQILIVRNAGEAARGGLAPLTLAPGETGIWDGRFEITAGAVPVTIEPLAGHAKTLTAKPRGRLRSIPAAARGALPTHVDPAAGRTCPILAQSPLLRVRSLVAARFAAACGVISKEPAA